MDADELLEDFKQLLHAEISQSEGRLSVQIDELHTDLGEQIDELRTQTNDGFAAIGDALTPLNDQVAAHETRLAKAV